VESPFCVFAAMSLCKISHDNSLVITVKLKSEYIGLGAFAASELDKVFSGYQPR
jgi:hypothetical protein